MAPTTTLTAAATSSHGAVPASRPWLPAPAITVNDEDAQTRVRARVASSDDVSHEIDGPSAAKYRATLTPAPDAPRIGPDTNTPVTERGRRPNFIDLAGLNGPLSGRSSTTTSPLSPLPPRLGLRAPTRPKLVSRFSSDDSDELLAPRVVEAGAVTPGTQQALFAFGISSGEQSPVSGLGTPLPTPDAELPTRVHLHSPAASSPLARRSVSSTGAGRMPPRTLSAPHSTSPVLLDAEAARALYDSLLPGVSSSPLGYSAPLSRTVSTESSYFGRIAA